MQTAPLEATLAEKRHHKALSKFKKRQSEINLSLFQTVASAFYTYH